MSEEQQVWPDERGYFGEFGGRFVSETLMHALDELREAYGRWRTDDEFVQRMDEDLANYVGRPSPVYYAKRYSEAAGGAKIYLKREDLNHTGAHKINNTMGQGCWPTTWERNASLLKPVPDSTVLHRPRWRPG